MRRNDIWTVSDRDYAGKPRPAVIVQDDSFPGTTSISICAFTTDPTEAPLFRVSVEQNDGNGLHTACRLMVDKIATVPKARLGVRIGRWGDEDALRLNRAFLVFLGLAGSARDVSRLKPSLLSLAPSRPRPLAGMEELTGTLA